MNAAAQVDLFAANDGLDKFLKFHQENPHVYRLFERRALEMITAGVSNFGARTILEVARWDEGIQTGGEAFKINNDFVPRYADLFREIHPEHAGFFRSRKKRAA